MEPQQNTLPDIRVIHAFDGVEVVLINQHVLIFSVLALGLDVDSAVASTEERKRILGDDVLFLFLGDLLKSFYYVVFFRSLDNLLAQLHRRSELVRTSFTSCRVQFLERLAGIRPLGLISLALRGLR